MQSVEHSKERIQHLDFPACGQLEKLAVALPSYVAMAMSIFGTLCVLLFPLKTLSLRDAHRFYQRIPSNHNYNFLSALEPFFPHCLISVVQFCNQYLTFLQAGKGKSIWVFCKQVLTTITISRCGQHLPRVHLLPPPAGDQPGGAEAAAHTPRLLLKAGVSCGKKGDLSKIFVLQEAETYLKAVVRESLRLQVSLMVVANVKLLNNFDEWKQTLIKSTGEQ